MAFVFDDEKQEKSRYVFDDEPEGPVIQASKDFGLFDRIVDTFKDPEKERAKSVQALVDSEALGISPSDAYRYQDAIADGVKMNKNAIIASRRTNTMDRISQSWQTGIKQNQLGLIGYDYLTTGNPALLEELNKVGMPTEDETFVSEGRLEEAFRAAAKMTPMMLHIGKESFEKGLPVSVGAGLAVAILGQMGPQVALPEELVTVPIAAAAGMKVGATAAAFHEALKLEGGLALSEIIQFKDAEGTQIDPDIARAAAFGIGAVNAALELAQIKTLLKTIPGMDKIVGQAVMDTVTSKVLIEKLTAIAGLYAGTIAKETGLEVAQESTNIVFSEIAKNVNNAVKGTDIDPASVDEIVNRLYDTAVESAQAFSVMAAPGNIVRAGMPTKDKAKTPGTTPTKAPVVETEKAPSTQPFILGVNEDANGEVKSFTMADPVSGETFEVAALRTEDKETLRLTPDMEAVSREIESLRETEIDANLDQQINDLIESDTDIDQVARELFGEQLYDVPDFIDEAKPETILTRVKAINDSIGEKGSIDLTPLVDLGRSIWSEGHTTIEAFTTRAKELLGDVWDKVKELVKQAWDTLNNERGSFSTKEKYDVGEVNELLEMAARQDKALEISESPSYDEVRAQAAKLAYDKISKKIDFKKRKEAAAVKRQGKDDARQLPVYQAMEYIVQAGGLDSAKMFKDYDAESLRELSKRRIGLVKQNGKVELDVVADQFGFEAADDLYNEIMDWPGLEEMGKKLADEFQYRFGDMLSTAEMDNFNELLMAEESKILDQLTAENRPKPSKGLKKFIREKTGQARPKDKMVTEYMALTEAFRTEAATARKAFSEGKKDEVERSKEKMRWLVKRRESLKNVRDYFGLTDAELMQATNRRNPALMDDGEYKQFLTDVQQKAVELSETRQEKLALLKLIEEKRLKKVDNYRQALELPTFNEMNAQQLRDFAKLLEPFMEDDIFLTQRELETVDRTDLKGIRTWREARERLAKEIGVDVEELNNVHVKALDSFRFDSALRERDPFFDVLVSRMTEAILGAELRSHEIETKTFELAKKSDQSRERGIVDRLIPQDDLIMAFLEAPMDRKAAIVDQMTPEQINFANFMQAYFADALNYLIATKALDRGRENYFVHIRKTFLENLKDGGLKKAVSEIFKTYQQDQMVFNILDDDTGKILPLEKFFQFSLQRTDTMDPTRNVTKAFLTYMKTFEKKKMFDAIIPKLDIYAQSLTPTRYTPRGLEIDRSLKTFVNKWINNKKGRRISFDSTLRQGGPLDVSIRALRTFTTIKDLGLSPFAQAIALVGEQVANATMVGSRGMALGSSRMVTPKGRRVIEKYRSFVGRSLWENLTAPGKEVSERLRDVIFSGFHASSVVANKQFLLASMTKEEWANETIAPARLAEMQLDMGRWRVVPGSGSLVGSTSLGDAANQYKKWSVPITRTLIKDISTLSQSIGKKPFGETISMKETQELMRVVYMTTAVIVTGAVFGADDDTDKSVIGKAKSRLYREAMTLIQGLDARFWLLSPRIISYLAQIADSLKSLLLLETHQTGQKRGQLKGDDKLRKAVTPGAINSLIDESNKGRRE